MKKIIFLGVLAVITLVGLTSCKSCKSNNNEQKNDDSDAEVYHDYDGVVQDFTAGVANIQALHHQTMYQVLGVKNFEWRNSKVVFNDTITSENIDDLHITDVNDVFYYWDEKTGPWVQFINTNVKAGLQIEWPINDVWIEDRDLNKSEIKLSAEQALQRLKEVNCPIPPAKGMILRLPLGPVACNPQWVIGDVYNVLFIDATTGEVRDSDPAFNPKNSSDLK